MEPPRASIVIPGHNAAPHYGACLASIYAQSCQDLEVIWVDSGSTDGSPERLLAEHPRTRVVALDRNAGYRCGVMAGAREACGDYLVVCNQDTRMEPDWLERMIACVESDPRAGIVAPCILMFDEPSIMNEAGNTLHFSGLYGSRGLRQPRTMFSAPETIGTMSGCCFLIRRSLWEALGGFSPDFDALDTGWYASFEDVDLAWRARLLGFDVRYCPDAVMYHKYERKALVAGRFCTYEWGRSLTVLRNYRLSTLVLLSPVLAGLEVATWLYAIAKGRSWVAAKSRVLRWFVTHPGQLRTMRARVQAERRVGDHAVVSMMSPAVPYPAEKTGSRMWRLARAVIDGLLTAYYKMFKLALKVFERPAGVGAF